jgi:hypothetical protein
MKGKISKHTNINDKSDIKPKVYNDDTLVIEEYFSVHTMKFHPATKKFVEQEAMRLKEFADVETSLRLSDFYDFRGYNTETFYSWCHKFPEMKAAHDYAKRRIGARRENGALFKKFDAGTVQRTLGFYDYVFQQEVEKANAARLAVAEKSESRVVVIERFPSPSGEYQDVEVVSSSKLTPEEVASNIRRNIATEREVKVNVKGKSYD